MFVQQVQSQSQPVDPMVLRESPHGEIVFALSKAVACVVVCAACLFLSVLMIIAKYVLSTATARYGILPLMTVFVVTVSALANQMGFSLNLLARIFLRSCC